MITPYFCLSWHIYVSYVFPFLFRYREIIDYRFLVSCRFYLQLICNFPYSFIFFCLHYYFHIFTILFSMIIMSTLAYAICYYCPYFNNSLVSYLVSWFIFYFVLSPPLSLSSATDQIMQYPLCICFLYFSFQKNSKYLNPPGSAFLFFIQYASHVNFLCIFSFLLLIIILSAYIVIYDINFVTGIRLLFLYPVIFFFL